MSTKKTILGDGLTNKQRILQMVQRWDDDIPFDKALYHMYVMKEVMEGIKDAEEGRVHDFDEVFNELERLCAEEENQVPAIEQGDAKPERLASLHRKGGSPKNGGVVRKASKKIS